VVRRRCLSGHHFRLGIALGLGMSFVVVCTFVLGAATSPFEFLGWVLRLCVLERCHVDAARVLANVFS